MSKAINLHTQRFVVIYLFASIVLSIYGAEVCPYIDRLSFGEIFPVFSISFISVLIFRSLMLNQRSSFYKVFWVELIAWLIAGLLVSCNNLFLFDFPVGSGLKVLVGYVALGIQSASYFALLIEKDHINESITHLYTRSVNQKSASIPTRLYVLVLVSHILTACVVCLILVKDYHELEVFLNQTQLPTFSLVLVEIALCFAIFLGSNAIITKVYANNLKLLLKNQLHSMNLIAAGHLDVIVPVSANHEMGMIGTHTNQMIKSLRERKQLQSIFDKLVSPEVAHRILSSESGDQLGGREIEATIMFMDIRNFTSMSEQSSPADIVQLLNLYFSVVVEIIHQHHGVVDKFIGDAVMAVFGFDETSDVPSTTSAVQASLAIKHALVEINQQLTQNHLPTITNGIGLHYGSMISGNIGSPQRLEYTVIGDTVNVGARLESTCKSLETWLCISHTVYELLDLDLQEKFMSAGEVTLKGKSTEVTVFIPKERDGSPFGVH